MIDLTEIQKAFPWLKEGATFGDVYMPAIEIAKNGLVKDHHSYFEAMKMFQIATTPELLKEWEERKLPQAYTLSRACNMVKQNLRTVASHCQSGTVKLVTDIYGAPL